VFGRYENDDSNVLVIFVSLNNDAGYEVGELEWVGLVYAGLRMFVRQRLTKTNFLRTNIKSFMQHSYIWSAVFGIV
jgi:hypothetical protein